MRIPVARAGSETEDSIAVLEGGGLHPEAVTHLKKSQGIIEEANLQKAIGQQEEAEDLLIETP